MTELVRTVTQGQVRGELLEGGAVVRFLGVPYGGPTGGNRRFLPAPPAPSWSGVRDCTSYGPAAPQPADGLGETERARALTAMIPAIREGNPQGEDCLVLNIWAGGDQSGPRKPVMVSIHGGGHTIGSAGAPMYDGALLAEHQDVVVVTVNHRLGVFGYLYLGEFLGDDYADSGNVGNLDLVAALAWVRDNIAAFGGDPENVTIFGESGGGGKVSALMAMPAAAGLFHRAIIQSGPKLRALSTRVSTETAGALLAELGLGRDEAAELINVPVDTMIAAQVQVLGGALGGVLSGGRPLGPVRDGAALPRHPFDPDAPDVSASVPLLIGTTRDEMSLFVYPDEAMDDVDDAGVGAVLAQTYGDRASALHDTYRAARPQATPRQRLIAAMTDMFRIGSVRIAERKYAQGGAPVWMYRFDFGTDVCDNLLGAPHAIDVPYTFDNPDVVALTGKAPGRHELAHLVSGAWSAFARNGSPQTPELPDWPPYDLERRATMVFDQPCHVLDDPDSAERRAWADLPAGT